VTLIEIGKRNYLLYLILSHPAKMALLSGGSRARLDRRFRVERILGRIPVLRHAGSILAIQARRKA
jgi:hypothetical protein